MPPADGSGCFPPRTGPFPASLRLAVLSALGRSSAPARDTADLGSPRGRAARPVSQGTVWLASGEPRRVAAREAMASRTRGPASRGADSAMRAIVDLPCHLDWVC